MNNLYNLKFNISPEAIDALDDFDLIITREIGRENKGCCPNGNHSCINHIVVFVGQAEDATITWGVKYQRITINTNMRD